MGSDEYAKRLDAASTELIFQFMEHLHDDPLPWNLAREATLLGTTLLGPADFDGSNSKLKSGFAFPNDFKEYMRVTYG